jgi:hypothetical protein
MRFKLIALLFCLAVILGCGSKPPAENATSTENRDNSSASNSSAAGSASGEKTAAPKPPGLMDRLTNKTYTVPEGTIVSVRLGEALGSKISQPGQSFDATLAEPIVVDGKEIVPAGADAHGTVVDAKGLGHFKGGALLQIQLNSIKDYKVQTASVNRSAKGKGKRSAVMIGGGAGAGALIGALAGGGKGAAIGALAGGGAGTAGTYFTGNKEVVLPAETVVSFKLLQPIEVKM